MATTTTNLGLTKPAYADTADIEVINGNMDILDAAANAMEGGMAIIANNNNHSAVSKGQFVYVRKHSSLAEGLYKATSNIAANGTLSNSNLAVVSAGLGGEIASVANDVSSLYDQIANKDVHTSFEGNSNFSISNNTAYRSGNVVEFRAVITGEITAGFVDVGTTTQKPMIETEMYVRDTDNSNVYVGRITPNGTIQIYRWNNLTQSAGKSMFVSATYIAN